MDPTRLSHAPYFPRSRLRDHLREDPVMERRTFLAGTGAVLLATPLAAEAQQAAKKYRVGIVLEGGPYYTMIDGLRDGLKESGFEEGTQYILHIRDVKGDRKAVEGSRARKGRLDILAFHLGHPSCEARDGKRSHRLLRGN